MILSCPQCDSKAYKRNGYTRHGKQNHRCLDCGRQFSLEPQDIKTSEDQIQFVGRFSAEGFCIEALF
jgi:transposase-like protein